MTISTKKINIDDCYHLLQNEFHNAMRDLRYYGAVKKRRKPLHVLKNGGVKVKLFISLQTLRKILKICYNLNTIKEVTNMKLDFKINKHYLLIHAIKSHTSPFDEWVELPNKLWEISNDAYWFLFNPASHDLIFTKIKSDKDFDLFLNTITAGLRKIINTAFKSKEFEKLFKETEEYMYSVEKKWISNQKNITETIEELLGEKLPGVKIEILITHPNLNNGIALPISNTICWGHKENWPNYSMVYLAHEILHLVLDKKLGKNNLTHAIIELIADQELRIRLNKKGIYFKEAKEGVGHPFLLELSKAILPHWKKYLKRKNKNITDFYSEIKNIPKIKKLLGFNKKQKFKTIAI